MNLHTKAKIVNYFECIELNSQKQPMSPANMGTPSWLTLN